MSSRSKKSAGKKKANAARKKRNVPSITKLRRAHAGLGILAGKSNGQALRDAGYADSTSKVPASHGLSARVCIDTAAELYPEVDPSQLVKQARTALTLKLGQLLEDGGKPLRKVGIAQLPRLLEVVERYYGGHDKPKGSDARGFVDRLEWLRDLGLELRRRGLTGPVQTLDAAVGESASYQDLQKNGDSSETPT